MRRMTSSGRRHRPLLPLHPRPPLSPTPHMFSQRLLVPVRLFRVPVRGTVWPANYMDPVFRKEDQTSLSDEDRKKLAFVPVKAVRNNVTCSVFFDPTINRLTKMIMRHGRFFLARDIMDRTLFNIKRTQIERLRQAKSEEEREEIEQDPVLIVKQAIANMRPVVITKPIKRGGATYQVPHPISPNFSEFLAMKWMLDILKARPKPQKESIHVVMARELLAAYNNDGKVVKKKTDMHRACEANKAYAHYRWG